MAPLRRKGGGGGEGGASKKSGGGGGSGRSFWGKSGFEGEVANNLIDVVCTWTMLSGMALSAVWSNWAIPHFCSATNETDTILTFNCVERVVFGYIFCFIALSVTFMPPYTTNPWEVMFIGVPLPRRIIKFGLQISAAALFAAALNRASSEFSEGLYQNVFPRVNLCGVKPFTAYHEKVFKGEVCFPEWPSWSDKGKFSLGVVLTEGLHVFVLNFLAGIILPRVGALIPIVLPSMVITAIRSRFSYSPGPALNLIPATAGAVLHGGLDSWRAHALGCGLGMTLAYLAEKRLHVIDGKEFTSAWSFRAPGAANTDDDKTKPRVTRSVGKKKAEEFVAKKKANDEFDPNSMDSSDYVIKGVTAHSNVIGGKSKKE